MTIYATMNPLGSTHPKDLRDNSQNLDYWSIGPLYSYPDRLGVNRLSRAGIEASFAAAQAQRNAQHNADQARRESEFDSDQARHENEFDTAQMIRANKFVIMEAEFDADQARRESEFDLSQGDREYLFDQFMSASGLEEPIPYAPGILLDRTTKTVTYLGKEYRVKSAFKPLTTTDWASDGPKLLLVGDDSLRQDVASSLDAVKGAGVVGFDPLLPYPQRTIGSAVSQIDSRAFGLLCNGTDETVKFGSIAAALAGSGLTLIISKGVLQLRTTVEIQGFSVNFAPGAAVCAYGADQSAFKNGALRVKENAKVTGTAFTSGSMVGGFADNFSVRPAVIYVDGGEVDMVVYSQIYAAVKYRSGTGKVRIIGGVFRGFLAELNADIPYSMEIEYQNQGVAYVDKLPSSFTIEDARAVHIIATVPITSELDFDIKGDLCTKNGLWIQGDGLLTGDQVQRLSFSGKITRAGYYRNAAGVIVMGHGAGTCVTTQNCPLVGIHISTAGASGYNVAVTANSRGARVTGDHYGNGGDPVVVIVNSDDCWILGSLKNGTVGVSVGEGTPVNNTTISAKIRDMTAAPVTFFAGNGLHLLGADIAGEPTLASFTGAMVGPGKTKPVVIVYPAANDVTMTNTSVQGYFSHDVIDRSSIPGRLRVNRVGGAYTAPIINRDDISLNRFSRQGDSAKYTRIINDTDTAGHAGVGEFNLPGSGAAFGSMVIAPSMANMTDFDISGTDLASVRSKYAILVYMKYVPGANGNRIGFSLQDGTGGTVHSPEIFYGAFGDPANPPATSIQGVLHKLADGEWVPLVMPLNRVIYSGANPAALTRFLVYKMDNAGTYDLTITKPVLIYIGSPEK